MGSRPAKSALPEALIEDVAMRFRALSEPVRLRILQQLQEGERSVNEVTQTLGAGQSNVSRHLQALFDAGLVARRREGNTVYYGIADPMIFELCHLVCDSARRDAKARLTRLARG